MDSAIAKPAKAIGKLADVHDRRLEELAKAVQSVSDRIKLLGNADTMTPMGALEGLGKSVQDSATVLSDALSSAAERIAESARPSS